MNILLIDDQPVLYRDILTAYNYSADVALNGYQAIRLLCQEGKKYDLVILDLEMPIMDGWEILTFIRNDEQVDDLFVMMLTANTNEDATVKGLNRGADKYLTKPISPELLIANIKSFERRIKQEVEPNVQASHRVLELLTSRETEIMELVIKGYSNKDIANKLFITETTVKNHLANIYHKLNVANRTQAAFYVQKLLKS